MTDHDAELDAILAAAQAAGLIETYEQNGEEMMRLTPEGERVARQLSMSGEEDADALMKALLGK